MAFSCWRPNAASDWERTRRPRICRLGFAGFLNIFIKDLPSSAKVGLQHLCVYSVVMSHATCDSSPHSRSWRSWASDNFSKAKGLLVYTLLCSLGIASLPEVAAACKRFAKSIALKMSIVFPAVFRKLLPTSCRCASRPSPAVRFPRSPCVMRSLFD